MKKKELSKARFKRIAHTIKSREELFSLFVIFLIIFFYAFLFFKRGIYPDVSTDTLNYHFSFGKQGYNNFPFAFSEKEFYPLGIGYGPLMDMLGHIGYLIFGYRLGTFFSLLSIVGVSIVFFLILNRFVGKQKNVYFFVLFFCVLMINEALFQIATFFTDNLHAFILTLYVLLLLKYNENKQYRKDILLISALGFILGLSITKPTNMIYALPIIISTSSFVYLKNKVATNYTKIFIVILTFFSFFILANFYAIDNYFKTGNPVFPLYNGVFKSVYYPTSENIKFNFGPTDMKQKIFFPFYALQNPGIMGEAKDLMPDIKLILIFFFNIICLAFFYFKKIKSFTYTEKNLFFIFLVSFIFWQWLFGYSRYAIFLEIIGGLCSILVLKKVFDEKIIFLKIISYAFLVLMVTYTYRIILFNLKYDLSWRPTPTFSIWSKLFFNDAIFQKYTKTNKEVSAQLDSVEAVFQCVIPSSAYSSTVKKIENLPLLNFDKHTNRSLTSNDHYIIKRNENASVLDKDNSGSIEFALMYNEKLFFGESETAKKECLKSIEGEINIYNEYKIDNFVGDKSKELELLLGSYRLEQ